MTSPSQILSETQLKTLLSLAEAFIPALTESDYTSAQDLVTQRVYNPKWDAVERYLQESCSSDPAFAKEMQKLIAAIPEAGRNEFKAVLDILLQGGDTAAFFTGTTQSFPNLKPVERTKVIQKWGSSDNPMLQGAFASLKPLVLIAHMRTSSVAHAAMEYPNHRENLEPVKDFFNFQFQELPEEGFDADLIIVGSGAGGGVAADKLSTEFKRTKRIVILDQGQYITPDNFPLSLEDAGTIYGDLGAYGTTDGKGLIMAGNTWGGSTVVNWSGGMDLPEDVMDEWAHEFDLSFTKTKRFKECIERCSKKIGVSDKNIKHNSANEVLLKGAQALNLPAKDIPQNTKGQEHWCGLCPFGCRLGIKQSTTVSLLVNAAQADVFSVQNCRVDKILFLDDGSVKGVKALHNGKEIIINAPRVILAAGALSSPCVLQRSRVQNENIGKNLKVHPCIFVVGSFDTKNTKAWEGSCMTAKVDLYEDPNHPGYGAKMHNMNPWPGNATFMTPWTDPISWKVEVLRSKQTVWGDIIIRDRDSVASVTSGPNGDPVIEYQLSDGDKKYLAEGAVQACRIEIAAGCDEIRPMYRNGIAPTASYRPKKDDSITDRLNDPAFSQYLDYVRQEGLVNDCWGSAHPMGSCRMGTDRKTSVVDRRGEVWGHKGLFVADASLFPTATGVNPMITTMAMADWVVDNIVQEMKDEF